MLSSFIRISFYFVVHSYFLLLYLKSYEILYSFVTSSAICLNFLNVIKDCGSKSFFLVTSSVHYLFSSLFLSLPQLSTSAVTSYTIYFAIYCQAFTFHSIICFVKQCIIHSLRHVVVYCLCKKRGGKKPLLNR